MGRVSTQGSDAIGETAWRNFHTLKSQFDGFLDNYGGVLITIDPFREFWPKEFAERLQPATARSRLHHRLRKWASVAKQTDLFTERVIFAPRSGAPAEETLRAIQISSDPDSIEAWWLITGLYWNLCSIVTFNRTIEELVWQAWCYKKTWTRTATRFKTVVDLPEKRLKGIEGVQCLLGLSRSFLMAEWMKDLVFKAVANNDEDFFKAINRGLGAQIPRRRKAVVNTWLPVVLLWYLGGEDIRPRSQFMQLLLDKHLMSESSDVDESAFRARLSQFGLTRR